MAISMTGLTQLTPAERRRLSAALEKLGPRVLLITAERIQYSLALNPQELLLAVAMCEAALHQCFVKVAQMARSFGMPAPPPDTHPLAVLSKAEADFVANIMAKLGPRCAVVTVVGVVGLPSMTFGNMVNLLSKAMAYLTDSQRANDQQWPFPRTQRA